MMMVTFFTTDCNSISPVYQTIYLIIIIIEAQVLLVRYINTILKNDDKLNKTMKCPTVSGF